MRFLPPMLLAALPLTVFGAIPLPDQSTVTDLQEFRLSCQSQAATISLLESTGEKDKAATLRARLWERYDAELFVRRCALADTSLAALNPFLPTAERKAAADALAPAVAQLAELSTFAFPDPAARARELEQAGGRPTDAQRARAETHETLQKIREQLSLEALALPGVAALRRDLVTQLTRAAATRQPLGELLVMARDIPVATESLQNLTRKFAEPDLIEELYRRTGDSLVLEATLTALIEAAPTNEVFWLARARARLQLGWRSGAAIDATIGGNLAPASPGLEPVSKLLKEVPASVTGICQEWVDSDDAMDVMRLHRMAEMGNLPVTELAPALERTARAAVRNRARRLYATSFVNKPEARQRALALIAEANLLPPGLFPFVAPELGQQYEAELAAAGTDTTKLVAIQQRHAALFGITEGFWHHQIMLLYRGGQPAAAYAATDIAGAMFSDSAWIKEVRDRTDPAQPLPPAEKN